MTFKEAKEQAKQGRIVTREQWGDKYLTIETPYDQPYVCQIQGDSKLLGWLTAQDINATDWQVNG